MRLSAGLKQRVGVARALAANPDILYMHEPFGALDSLTRLKLSSELIPIWQQEKKTIDSRLRNRGRSKSGAGRLPWFSISRVGWKQRRHLSADAFREHRQVDVTR